MQGQRIGYVRVNSFDQNPDRQLEQIEVVQVVLPIRLLAFVGEGDTVVGHSMDRLARNLDDLRRRVQAGLNKGEVHNALARAVFFNRLGDIRDRSFEQQRYRTSGLNLVTAAIVLWNTAYLERATNALNGNGKPVDETLLHYLSPLGWEHINLTGDYPWRSSTLGSWAR